MNKEELKKYANLLLFDMEENEYDRLLKEFDVILNQMDLISHIDNISLVEPMTFINNEYDFELRSDEILPSITMEEFLSNVSETKMHQVILPKVVE